MTSDPPILFVAWQHPVERKFHVVGRLRRTRHEPDTGYEFVYVRGAEEARDRHGFRPFFAFPRLDTVYHSDTLFPFVANRILRSTRRDYPAYIQELGLTPEEASPERILSRSGGKRMTDYVEIFAPPQPNPETGLDEMFFLLRGLRYMPPGAGERIAALRSGEQLFCMLDFQNLYNCRAIALRTADNHLLGYAPDYLTEDVERLREERARLTVVVDRVNPPPAPQGHRLLCRLQARWPEDRAPFSDERFQSLVPTPDDPAVDDTGPLATVART